MNVMKMKLLFDCDDTLYDLSWPFEMSVERMFDPALLRNTDRDQFYADYRKAGDAIFDQVQNGTISIDESGIYRIKEACKKHGIPIDDKKAQDFQNMYRNYQSNITMTDDLKAYLIDSDAVIGVLTNGEHSHQYAKLSALGVFDFIPSTRIFTSGKIGYAKPDPRSFEHVMKTFNDDAINWYYIGDHYRNDMVGAKKAGMKTIHFNRHHQEEGDASDYVVYTEKELIDLLKELSA